MIPVNPHSRRAILGFGTAALALAPSFGRAATTDTPLADSGPVQGDLDAFHHMTLETYIDGQGPFRFVVDTGADQTVVADDVAVKLGLVLGEQVVVQGIAQSAPAPTVQLVNLAVGQIKIERLRAPVLRRAWLGADGYLGLDALDGRRVNFDFQHNTLTVTQSHAMPEPTKWLHPDQMLVRANGDHGRLTAVNCHVEGVRAHAFVDSGAEVSIGNTRLFEELQKSGKTYIDNELIPVIGITGGQAYGRMTRISSIRLGALEFVNGTLIISDLPVFDVWDLSDKPAMFVGMNFLRQTDSFSIDYGAKQMFIKIADVRIARAT